MNIQNVLGFVLANINRPIRLHALVIICQSDHVSDVMTVCHRIFFFLFPCAEQVKKNKISPCKHKSIFLKDKNDFFFAE